MIEIKKALSGQIIPYEMFNFGGGETHVKISDLTDVHFIDVIVKYMNDSQFVQLALIVDALRRGNVANIRLKIPYFPGARQDRVNVKGEPFSLKVYANLINAMRFDSVVIFDPHSDVTPAVIDKVIPVNNHAFIKDVISSINEEIILISPDAGSNKKIYDVSKSLGGLPVVRCDKLRDVTNGKIIDSVVYADNLEGKTCLIVDDICSYGGTFCGLAGKLKAHGAGDVFLAVSHFEGVASLTKLKDSGISGVYTTNSKDWNVNDYNKSGFITSFDIEKYL